MLPAASCGEMLSFDYIAMRMLITFVFEELKILCRSESGKYQRLW